MSPPESNAMCGIAGAVALDHSGRVDRARLEAMTRSLHHRGPDGEGFHIAGRVGLGFRRLAIIDLETGDQPIYAADGASCVVFNGEIYNYLELREELEDLGHQFRTTSDTEVVIRAYEEWDVDCLSRFNGMWAIAIWDDRKQRLFLSRDRIGQKPLFFAVHDEELVFGSEIKALRAYGVPATPNLEVLELYLALSYVPAPWTFYRGIHKLEPGHYILVGDEVEPPVKYWDVPCIADHEMEGNREVVERRFAELFHDAVRLRMRSDVPFGVFLSGGLDSSSVLAEMTAHSEVPIRAFTIGVDDPVLDERELARLSARRFEAHHTEEVVSPGDLDASIRRVVECYDEPFADSSAVPTLHVSELARRHVKMVLAGDGGDEVLSGYTSYQGVKLTRLFNRLPSLGQSLARAALSGAAATTGNSAVSTAARSAAVARLGFSRRMATKMSTIDPRKLKQLINADVDTIGVEDFIGDTVTRCGFQDDFYKLMFLDLKVHLPDDMLTKVDRATMAHSLEARMPFLDYRLIELMAVVDKNVKMPGLSRKSILRNTVGRQLPAQVVRGGKLGFSVPVGAWLAEADGARSLDSLPGEQIGLDPKLLGEVLSDQRPRAGNVSRLLWSLLILQEWLASL